MPTSIIAAAAAIGTGMSIFGGIEQRNAAQQSAGYQQQLIQGEQAAEQQRQKAMELDARRRTMEQLRQANVARATALTAASSDGAQFGSGLAGAYGNIAGASNFGMSGIQQNLGIGENIFGINQGISAARIGMAGAQSNYATAGMYSQMGGSLVNLGPTLGRLGGGFGGFSAGNYNTNSYAPSRGGMQLNY